MTTKRYRDEYAGLNFTYHMVDGFTISGSDWNGNYLDRRFIGYGKREAARLFRRLFREKFHGPVR